MYVDVSVILWRPGLWQGAVGLCHHPVRLEDLMEVLCQTGTVVDHHSQFFHLHSQVCKLSNCDIKTKYLHVWICGVTCVRALQSMFALPMNTCFRSTIQNLLWRTPFVRRPKFTALTWTPADKSGSETRLTQHVKTQYSECRLWEQESLFHTFLFQDL